MTYPQIDPVFFRLGPLQFRWYGLMYIIGFICSLFIARNIVRKKQYDLSPTEIEDLLSYCIAALVIGARIGYCVLS